MPSLPFWEPLHCRPKEGETEMATEGIEIETDGKIAIAETAMTEESSETTDEGIAEEIEDMLRGMEGRSG